MPYCRLLYCFITAALIFISCWSTDPARPSYEGMRLVRSSGSAFTLGLRSSFSSPEEIPPMLVSFSYDYHIDTTEVTIAQYTALMGTVPGKIADTTGISLHPVTYVSWYDAALFCNARSLASGYDTIYSYTGIEQDTDGRTYRLNGLKTNLDKTGYRLPLEAEWEFAAYGGTYTVFPWGNDADTSAAQNCAWFGLNAGETLHPVAQLSPNGYGLYDMFGNALELTNDYFGSFSEDTITNYSGPARNTKDERPVKGGAYKHTIEKLRPASRIDTYSTLSSTATAYIGFRCCIGPVPPQKGQVQNSGSDSANPVSVLLSDAASVFPRRNAKLVFVNKTAGTNHLSFIDFNEYNGRAYTFTDFSPVYCPTISPDGKRVAFCTNDEGGRGSSEIYIRKLDADGSELIRLDESPVFIPRWWRDPANGDQYIIYTTSAVDNSSSSWRESVTRMQKIVNGVPSGEPVALITDAGYHDGLSYDKQYIATGFTRLRMKDLTTGDEKILFTSPQNGKTDDDTSQVCNVSITPDSAITDRVLFLDFGSGAKGSTIVGSAYYSHQVVFMSDFSGDVQSWYHCPENAAEWNHVEWSSNADFAVATIKPLSAPQNAQFIYSINLVTKEYTPLAEGVQLLNPGLWIASHDKIAYTFNTDSLGRYNDPPSSDPQYQFALKMPMFWETRDSIDILCLGSSRIQNAVAPPVLAPEFTASHLSYAACDLYGIKKLIDSYVLYHCPELKAIVITIDLCFFRNSPENTTWNDIKVSKGYRYDATNEFWKAGLPDGFCEAVRDAGNPYIEHIENNRGWVEDVSKDWGPSPAVYTDDWLWEIDNQCLDNIALLREMVQDLQERGIHCIGIAFPMSPSFNDTPVYGTYGPTHDAAEQLITHISAIDAEYPLFHFYDLNNFGNHDYTDEDAVNDSHLSAVGAEKLTTWLKDELTTLLTVK